MTPLHVLQLIEIGTFVMNVSTFIIFQIALRGVRQASAEQRKAVPELLESMNQMAILTCPLCGAAAGCGRGPFGQKFQVCSVQVGIDEHHMSEGVISEEMDGVHKINIVGHSVEGEAPCEAANIRKSSRALFATYMKGGKNTNTALQFFREHMFKRKRSTVKDAA